MDEYKGDIEIIKRKLKKYQKNAKYNNSEKIVIAKQTLNEIIRLTNNFKNNEDFLQQKEMKIQEKESQEIVEDLKELEKDAGKKAKLRSYTYDSKTFITLKIKQEIFDKLSEDKDKMIIRFNDEWNLPPVYFGDLEKYGTGRKAFKANFIFLVV